ncbi:MAG: protein-L-isoaspartate(D-aspartate) O-methyltransferase [Planctomycetota bacterium]
MVACLLCAAGVLNVGPIGAQEQQGSYQQARQRLVERDLATSGIDNQRVLAAIGDVPRHRFVLAKHRNRAYLDMALPIGHGQTISPPVVVGMMTEQLDPRPEDRVLEIGTGSGYQAAVLSSLVADVYTIEIVEPLGRRAAKTLRNLAYENVHVKLGDGFLGWPEQAPFDKIIVTCSPEEVPPPLVEQLAEGGRLIVPLGQRFSQTLMMFTKKGGELQPEPIESTFFVPMTGQAEARRKRLPQTTLTPLLNGDFEHAIDATDQPAGWYYLRQGRLVRRPDAPSGGAFLMFDNRQPGRHAHGLHALGVDGRNVKSLELSLWVRGRNLRAGAESWETPQLMIEFFDTQRAPVGTAKIGAWEGTFDWERRQHEIDVPARARLAVVAVGLFGATGELSIDNVTICQPSEP